MVMSIVHWGDTHMVDKRGRPLLHQHKNCGKLFDPVMICSECGEPVHAKEVHTHPGPGAAKAERADPLAKKMLSSPSSGAENEASEDFRMREARSFFTAAVRSRTPGWPAHPPPPAT